MLLFRKSQWDSYPEKMAMLEGGLPVSRNSKLFQLSPVLDDNDLLRMDSRLDNVRIANMKTPVILDPRHYLTKLINHHFHVLALHQGQDAVRNEIRQQFWIPNLRVVTSQTFYTSDGVLPDCRVEPQQRSFSIVGMDYFAPMEVSVGRRHEKRYGVLFTCMTTRAIHLEVAHSLTKDRDYRGRYSANLRGADKELHDQEALTENMNSKGIKWNFISPSAPHMGGS
ncbi:hypothetical protein LAZ67_18000935 [Cordylochernes scorpioides]|uniref:Integrase zinc-binding domain-containing protein n=1 Tax=Cordylochernes scorpioides TaxID=51811 RepID=A0ABY6LGQ8_9ARAC|nr:hypothetical protein LAZ67_18000935 [Cordylochernes scorpioides]